MFYLMMAGRLMLTAKLHRTKESALSEVSRLEITDKELTDVWRKKGIKYYVIKIDLRDAWAKAKPPATPTPTEGKQP